MNERRLKTKRIYSGRIVSLREDTVKLSNGVVSKREIVEHPGAVAIIALTKDNKIIIERQFRTSAGEVLFEIPAGLAHKGENLAKAARRELIEETGYDAKKIRKVFSGFSSPGYSTEVITFFIAKDLKYVGQNLDHDEMIDVELVPLRKALELVKKGKVKDNKTALGIILASIWKK
jgi:ADP-ribose pyrophosphatase